MRVIEGDKAAVRVNGWPFLESSDSIGNLGSLG